MSRRGLRQRPSKPMTRPVKRLAEKKRRLAEHKKRLVALGVPEEELSVMTSQKIRMLLKRPKQTEKLYAS